MTTRKVQKAGAVIVSKSNPNNILLIFRTREQDWSFPKGHIEPGESRESAAIREIKEETSLDVALLRKLSSFEYEYPEGGAVLVHMFLAQSLDDSTLNTEHDTDELQWIDKERILEKLTHENLKSYFLEIQTLI